MCQPRFRRFGPSEPHLYENQVLLNHFSHRGVDVVWGKGGEAPKTENTKTGYLYSADHRRGWYRGRARVVVLAMDWGYTLQYGFTM